jgi:hypothetical protein
VCVCVFCVGAARVRCVCLVCLMRQGRLARENAELEAITAEEMRRVGALHRDLEADRRAAREAREAALQEAAAAAAAVAAADARERVREDQWRHRLQQQQQQQLQHAEEQRRRDADSHREQERERELAVQAATASASAAAAAEARAVAAVEVDAAYAAAVAQLAVARQQWDHELADERRELQRVAARLAEEAEEAAASAEASRDRWGREQTQVALEEQRLRFEAELLARDKDTMEVRTVRRCFRSTTTTTAGSRGGGGGGGGGGAGGA